MTVPLVTAFCLLLVATLGVAMFRGLIVRFKADDCLHLLDSDVPLIRNRGLQRVVVGRVRRVARPLL